MVSNDVLIMLNFVFWKLHWLLAMWHYDYQETWNTYQMINAASDNGKKLSRKETIVVSKDCPKLLGSPVTCGSQRFNYRNFKLMLKTGLRLFIILLLPTFYECLENHLKKMYHIWKMIFFTHFLLELWPSFQENFNSFPNKICVYIYIYIICTNIIYIINIIYTNETTETKST